LKWKVGAEKYHFVLCFSLPAANRLAWSWYYLNGRIWNCEVKAP